MERFSALLALCAVNSPVPGALRFSLICVWINGWVNNGEAGDFRRHHAHYDVTVMVSRLTTTRGPAPVPVPAKRTSLSSIVDSVTVDVLATQGPKSPAVMELTWLTTNNPVSNTGIDLNMRPANERRRYNVTSSLIGWTYIQNYLTGKGSRNTTWYFPWLTEARTYVST